MHPLAKFDAWHEWTIEDLDSLELEDWYRYEIVDGALLVSPAPGGDHELASHLLRLAVQSALPKGIYVVGPAEVNLGRSRPVPDLVVAELADLRRSRRQRPSDVQLVVEVVSPSSVRIDRVLKPALYAAAGIPNYWRVETDPISLTAYTLDRDAYRELGTWHAGDIARIETPYPIEIDVASLLPEV